MYKVLSAAALAAATSVFAAPMEAWDFAKKIDFDCTGVRREAGFRLSHRALERRDRVTIYFPWLKGDLPLVFSGERKSGVLEAKLSQRGTFAEAQLTHALPPSTEHLSAANFREALLEHYVRRKAHDVQYGKELEGGVSYREAFIKAKSLRFGAGIRFKGVKSTRENQIPNAIVEIADEQGGSRSIELRCQKPAKLKVDTHKAWVESTVALFEAVDAGDLEAAKAAILAGADLSVVDPETGDSVLHFAVGQPAMMKLLVEQDFLPQERRQELDVNAVNDAGDTVIWHAVTAYRKESVDYLKNLGALPKAFLNGQMFDIRDAILVTLGRPNNVGKGLSEAEARVMRRTLDRMWGGGSSMFELEQILAIIEK